MKNKLRCLILFFYIINLCFSSGIFASIPSKFKFQHFTIENGLSNNWVNCLTQDDRGNMWFGTKNGLNKFDGYSFKHYTNQYDDTTSISGNYIFCIEEDGNDVWVGTHQNGLCRYDSDKNLFERFFYQDQCDSCAAYRSIRSLAMIQNEIWVGTLDGIVIYNKASNRFREFHYNHFFSLGISISSIVFDKNGHVYIGSSSRSIYKYSMQTDKLDSIPLPQLANLEPLKVYEKELYIDSDGNLWIGSKGNGLWIYSPAQNQLNHYLSSMGSNTIPHNHVMGFEEVQKGYIFIATDNGGISVFNKTSKQFNTITANPADPFGLSSNGIYKIFLDRDHRIWIASFDSGINMWDPNKNKFNHYYHIVNDPNSLTHNNVISLSEGIENDIWIGTDGGGLNRFFPETGKIEQFRLSGNENYPINSNYIIELMLDSKDRLWVSGLYRGVTILDLKTGKSKHIYHDDPNLDGFPNNPVWDILEDRQGNIWFGTMGAGLIQYEEFENRFTTFLYQPNDAFSINSNFIIKLEEDSDGYIWIATEGSSLSRFDPSTEMFKLYAHNKYDSVSISSNIVNGVFESSNGELWFTSDNGLNQLNPDKKTFTVYREADGLSNNRTYDILEDNNGTLWVSSDNGLSQFNPLTKTFRNFYQGDGLQSNQFNQTAALKDKRGLFYFGGVYGLNTFYPDSIRENNSQPPIVLTELRIFNQPVSPQTDNSPLKEHISVTDKIVLTHEQNVFSLEFACLDFTNPWKIKYKYQLAGFDHNWIETSAEQRRVTYTNLASGNYTFKVKSTNSDGKWIPKNAILNITILPPFWQTWWFRFSVLLVFIGFMVAFHVYRTMTMRQRNFELEKINTALEKEVDERKKAEIIARKSLGEKDVLLKEIHHRVKNNLQIISSLLRLQSSKIEDEYLLDMFNDSRSRIRSMALIHEKLYQSDDFSHINFKTYTESIIRELKVSFKNHNHSIHFIVSIDNVVLPIDVAVPCGLVLNELVTNAYKYAFPDDFNKMASISVSMKRIKGQVELVVEDNGVGLPESMDPEKAESLGLTLVHILAKDQMGGKVTWNREKGTSCRILFAQKENFDYN